MEESIIALGTGDKLGAFTINTNKLLSEIFHNLWNVFGANGAWKKTLVLLIVLLCFVLIKLWFRRMDQIRRQKNRENQERKKAKIWKEEYKG